MNAKIYISISDPSKPNNETILTHEVDNLVKADEFAFAILRNGYRHETLDYSLYFPPYRIIQVKAVEQCEKY